MKIQSKSWGMYNVYMERIGSLKIKEYGQSSVLSRGSGVCLFFFFCILRRKSVNY